MGRKQKKQKKQQRLLKEKGGPSMAEQADLHMLYEASVQNVDFEVEFVSNTFKMIRGREARSLREDFCGTAQAACRWVKEHEDNTAIGVDLDADVLAWGREHHVAELTSKQEARIALLNQNVLEVDTQQVDVLLAMNFSYWCFKTREVLGGYFKRAYQALADDGVFFLDCFGGYQAYEELEEETDHEDFTYIWDQASYNAITGDLTTHIHFSFPDGSELRPAFTYEWRLWSLPEIRELLAEAGFKRLTVFSQAWDEETDEETDEYFPTETLDADPGWVIYITAEK